MGVRHYRDLIAWQNAMDFVVRVYEATEVSPPNERFGLTKYPSNEPTVTDY